LVIINVSQVRSCKPATGAQLATESTKSVHAPRLRTVVSALTLAAAGMLAVCTVWACAAIYFDLSWKGAGTLAALLYLMAVAGILILVRPAWTAIGWAFACSAIVLGSWLFLRPSNLRKWQPDVSETAWAEIVGDRVTIHNVRNASYRSETDYTPRWETRVVDLDSIRGADIFITYWGSPWIAHPIISFRYGNNEYLAFSIEVRKEIGEGYSAIRGFFRQFELIYIVADEKDVVRLRTNYREGEDVYAFRLRASPERARALFLQYVRSVNQLHERAKWYNALTTNCTTDIRRLIAATQSDVPWDWRILLNGRLDEMMYERGSLAGDLPLPELKRLAHINAEARASDQDADFSQRIRAGRPGF
jgi:hypothetical protein